ncbi:MAG: hypothetical protein J6Z34_05875, partial [Clostridia bacterium]|nr:hypothetical protein [Clostridia bacterium]
MGIVKIKNKKIIRAAACAMLSALLFIAVVICGGKNVFGWFSTNIETDVSGANVSVRTEKIRTDFYVYSYDLYGLHSFDSAVPSATYTAANPAYNAQDPDSEPTLQKPFTLENLK